MENAVNSSQKLVAPTDIESELLVLWQKLAKENKIRASLFNLVVYNQQSARTDYFRTTVQKVVSQFPCRIIFISYDPNAPHPYLKSAISLVTPGSKETSFACDQIDIGVGGASYLERIPSLLLSHLTPDLPMYLLWTEDPTLPNPLFDPLTSIATRIIFDSESTNDLLAFADTVLNLKEKKGIDVGDLNWARTEGWRDLISSVFNPKDRKDLLPEINLVKISYNESPTPFFCHLKIQSLYLLAWLSSCLNWKYQSSNESLFFQFDGVDSKIEQATWAKLGPGTVISVNIHTKNDFLFEMERIPTQYHQVKVSISNSEKCELPYIFLLGKTATGQSLVKEICTKGSSVHYLKMLKTLKILDKERRI